MINSSLLYLFLVTSFTGISQTLLKMGANHSYEKKVISAYINPYTFIAYFLYIVVTILTVYALKEIPLKFFYTATSLKFVFVLILSRLVLYEKIDKKKTIAIVLIGSGVVIFNI